MPSDAVDGSTQEKMADPRIPAGSEPQQDGGTGERIRFKRLLRSDKHRGAPYASSMSDFGDALKKPEKWSMGVLNDTETDEVPGAFWQEEIL